jgi:hypothetical protein
MDRPARAVVQGEDDEVRELHTQSLFLLAVWALPREFPDAPVSFASRTAVMTGTQSSVGARRVVRKQTQCRRQSEKQGRRRRQWRACTQGQLVQRGDALR